MNSELHRLFGDGSDAHAREAIRVRRDEREQLDREIRLLEEWRMFLMRSGGEDASTPVGEEQAVDHPDPEPASASAKRVNLYNAITAIVCQYPVRDYWEARDLLGDHPRGGLAW